MSALSIQQPYPIFTDIDGQPLEDGYVWIGTANLDPQTNPINVYWDAALTLPAAQPIRTLAGYPANSGTPARLYVNSDYSIRVMNKNGSVVYSAPAATERYSGVVTGVINASDVSYTSPGAGAVETTAENIFNETVSVKRFGAVGDGVTDDAAAIQAALNSGVKNVFLDDGDYFLANSTMNALPFNGLTAPSGVRFYGSSGARLLLDGAGSYSHVLVVGQLATDVTFENITIDGQGAYANGIVMAGLGGGANSNCHAIRCKVIDIHSARTPSANRFTVNQGGAAYVMELDGDGTVTDCSAVNCQFGIRYAPGNGAKCNYTVTNFYAEECEAILNTTPSNFDNRDYRQSATYNKIMPCQLVMNGVVFKNCGESTDQMTQFSFIWKDSSAEAGGRATGNYHPWAGTAATGVVTGTYAGLNWMPATYSASDPDWNPAATYSAGDRVKITNNGNLGALFCFGRVGGVTISNVRGWNDHFTGAYPRIGAVFRGIMRGVNIYNVAVDVSGEAIFSFGVAPSSTYDMQPFMISQYVYADNVFLLGGATNICDANMPWNGTWNTSFTTPVVVDYQFNQQFVYLTNIRTRGSATLTVSAALSTTAPAQVTTFDTQTNLEFIDSTNCTTNKGRFGDYAARISGTANNNYRETLGQTGIATLTGTGTPEGARTAPVGSIYIRTDGGTGTTFYVKETGTGNTGWVAK